jgi:hypothetical protein
MANEKAYKKESQEKGIRTYDIDSWDGFSDLFNDEFFTKKDEALNNKLYLGDYVWRGQRRANLGLVSYFDREFWTGNGDYVNAVFVYDPNRDTILKRHFNSFAYAVRGKLREFELTVREIKAAKRDNLLSNNHIWALGQHYGLKTPLLDWCYSPYVAAYFAFQEKIKKEDDQEKCRVVWGLNYKQVCDNYTEAGVFNTSIEYFDPMSSEHPRLINQRGLFTITKDGEAIKKANINDIDIEGIVKNNRCVGCNGPWLIKFKIIDSKENREEFLRRLNAMNINHISLFPEIKGAAEFSNVGLEFDEYARFHGQWW